MIYNWQEGNESRDFTSWLILSAILRSPDVHEINIEKNDTYQKIKELSENFTKCKLTMQINGIEINAQETINRISSQLDYEIEKKAKEILEENNRLSGVYKLINEFEYRLKVEFNKMFPNSNTDEK